MPTDPVVLWPRTNLGWVLNVSCTSPVLLVATTWLLRMSVPVTDPWYDRSWVVAPLRVRAFTAPEFDVSFTGPLSPETMIRPDRVVTSTGRARGTWRSPRTGQAVSSGTPQLPPRT